MTKAHLKFGVIDPAQYSQIPVRLASAEVFKANGCNLVVCDAGTGYFEKAINTDTLLAGVIEVGDLTVGSSDGDSVRSMIPANQFPVMRIKVLTGTIALTDILKTCDIVLSSNRIGLNVDASTYDTMLILDADVANNEALVTFNPEKLTSYEDTV